MGECKLQLYDHLNYGGDVWTISQNAESGPWNDRDASGKVTGYCKNVSFLGFEHTNQGGYAWLLGEGDSIPNFRDATGGKCDVEQHRFYKFHDQNNSIIKIDIPVEDINTGRMRHDLKIYSKRRDTRQCQWATYPDIQKTSDGQFSANDSDQWLVGHNDKKGQPCPGGTGYWKGFQTVSCVYNNKEGLQNLHGNSTANNDIRRIMWNTLVNRYCDRAERLDERVGTNTTCRNIVNAKAQAKSYCQGVPSRIATDKTFCTKSELGEDVYNELAETYCKANPTADFCACYNVTKNLCTEQPDLPGCKIVQPIWDKIKETLDEGDIAQFEGMQPCYGSVCTGNVYQPDKWDANCNKSISICKADFKIGGDLVGSNISLKQDCGNTTNEGGGSGGGSGSGSSETTTTNNDDDDDDDDEEKTLIEKIFKLKEDKDKKFIEKRVVKVGGGILSLIFCLLCIITLIMFA